MSAIVFVFAFCIVAVLVYVARFSGRVRAGHARVINAPLAVVWLQVQDLTCWTRWNPWLEHAGSAVSQSTMAGLLEGGRHSWSATNVSEATVVHLHLEPMKRIEQAIAFQWPFKVKGKLVWTFVPKGNAVEVSCQFSGRVGFSLRAFSKVVQGALGLDLRFGLDRIARIVEPPSAPRYVLHYDGVRDVPAMQYAYVTHRGAIGSPAQVVSERAQALRDSLAGVGQAAAGPALVAYQQTNIKLRTVVCQIGLPIDVPELAGHQVQSRPEHRAYVLRLQGDAQSLELAWYHAMQRLRAMGLEPNSRIAPLEVFLQQDAAGQACADIELQLPLR